MRLFVATILLVAGLFHGLSLAASYKVTKVIEVGPAAWVPFVGPLKWSPDGTMLAYFANNYLMISDTLGNVRDVKAIDSGVWPRRYEWVSNTQVAVRFEKRFGIDSLYSQLVVIDVNTGIDTVFEEYVWRKKFVRDRAGDVFFEGPFLTLEGNAYYLKKTHTGHRKQIPLGWTSETIDEPHLFFPDKGPAMRNNHLIRWGIDGLYLTSLDNSDSTKISQKPSPDLPNPNGISADRSHVINGGLLVRLADGVITLLDTIHIEVPVAGAICGFVYTSFNPKSSEVLFQLTCDKGHMTVADRIGTFNYLTGEFNVYDPPEEAKHCTAPIYAPDGKKIAFLANNKTYIMYREEK